MEEKSQEQIIISSKMFNSNILIALEVNIPTFIHKQDVIQSSDLYPLQASLLIFIKVI